MRTFITVGLMFLTFVKPGTAGESRKIEGRVVDEKGGPVINASVDFFWRANGSDKDQSGKPIDPADEEGNKLFWGRLGQMEPFRVAKSGEDGRFSIERPDNFHTLMAMDAERARGGLAEIPKDESAQVEIRVQPLVRVTGRFEGPEPAQRPSWTHVWTLVPEDPTRPLHTNRLISCGSHEARFAMSLPPGRYVLDANDDTAHGVLEREIILTGDNPEIDLGTLKLSRVTRKNINEKIKQSQTSGAMRDYTKHYGEELPAWHIVDARGASKDVQLSDYKGKWVLVNFWALNCNSCLKHHLPKLAKFYRDHQGQLDRFEILAICVDCDEKMNSIADVDRQLEPIVKYVWDGQPLPFPVLLDPSMTTLERFGVPGYESILVDPDGKLIEGDESTLEDKLKE
jgi:thiol-disulfide isomerase/thioredoxin